MNPIFGNEPRIFTTGAFLQPAKVIDRNGKETWLWYVSEFIDDSFMDGETYNPKESASSEEELLLNTTPDLDSEN